MSLTTIDRINGINSGVAIKAPCRVATTANITLSGEQTIDGVAVVAGDRVLVKNQTSGINNGVYVASTSAWQRDLDFNGINDVVTGTVIYIVAGTTNANSAWQVSTTGTITIGTTSIAFTQSANLSGASAFMLTVLDDTSASAALTTLGVSAFVQTVLDDATAAAARTTLGALSDAPAAVPLTSLATQAANTFVANATASTATPTASVSLSASQLAGRGASGNLAAIALGTNLSMSGTTLNAAGSTVSTTQATTSGTTKDFTSLPSGIKRITIMFSGVRTNGTSNFLIQGMVSGSAVTSGYNSSAEYGGTAASSTAGFIIRNNAAADAHSGIYVLTHLGSNVWSGAGTIRPNAGTGAGGTSGGDKTFAGTLDGIRITSVTPDTFVAGNVNIMYEV